MVEERLSAIIKEFFEDKISVQEVRARMRLVVREIKFHRHIELIRTAT